MSSVENTLKIIKILYERDKITVKELGKQLNLSPRQIHKYIDEMTCLSIPINTKRGRYDGGIWLDNSYKQRDYNLLTDSKSSRKHGKSKFW